ncbi:hypothetical protein HK405_007123, partial [Cladochytrium tenue]
WIYKYPKELEPDYYENRFVTIVLRNDPVPRLLSSYSPYVPSKLEVLLKLTGVKEYSAVGRYVFLGDGKLVNVETQPYLINGRIYEKKKQEKRDDGWLDDHSLAALAVDLKDSHAEFSQQARAAEATHGTRVTPVILSKEQYRKLAAVSLRVSDDSFNLVRSLWVWLGQVGTGLAQWCSRVLFRASNGGLGTRDGGDSGGGGIGNDGGFADEARWSEAERVMMLALLNERDRAEKDGTFQSISHSLAAAGTCKMGNPADPSAVVNAKDLKVKRFSTILPVVTSGNTNAPAIMIGEVCADMIRGKFPSNDTVGISAKL